MYHRIIILALLFLNPGKSNSSNLLSSLMEISNALPVQFWLVGCDTYNEHEAAGVHHKCYCAPWQCDDEIKVQFKDTPSQSFSLVILNSDEQELGSFDFDEIDYGVYQYSLNLGVDSPDICDEQIQLKIRRAQTQEEIEIPSMSEWLGTTDDPSRHDWTTGAEPFVYISGASTGFPGELSEYLYGSLVLIPGQQYRIDINYTKDISLSYQNPRFIFITLFDDSFNNLFSSSGVLTPNTNIGPTTAVFTFTAPVGVTQIAISARDGSNATYTIHDVTGYVLGDPEFVAKSDCLDIRQEHQDSILLTYSNHRNFAGLVYEDFSPANEFQIRVPAVFFHQRFPEEDETMELSTSLVTLNGTVRKQRLLDTDYLPYYFHEKLKLILKHQILEIFNRQWVKQEGYEIVEGDRRWPMKKAKCWLSEKDFVHRNIL